MSDERDDDKAGPALLPALEDEDVPAFLRRGKEEGGNVLSSGGAAAAAAEGAAEGSSPYLKCRFWGSDPPGPDRKIASWRREAEEALAEGREPEWAAEAEAALRDGIALHPRSIIYLKKLPPRRLAKVFSAVRDELYFNPPTPEKYRKGGGEVNA